MVSPICSAQKSQEAGFVVEPSRSSPDCAGDGHRIWQWHFGHGIVGTPNDFGRQGEEPSHPQLLDWLATEFAANGWSINAMHRLIMESSTYRMSSRHPESSYARTDPENRLLWRMNRRRLEAEALWDSVHAVAGTLNLKLGGRSVSPPLSADEFDALSGNGPYEWFVSTDPADHRRRGIYIVVKRNFPFPMFEAFDLPDNSASCPEREVTTVTPQVLWFMNHELALSQAQHFAHRLLREEGDSPPAWAGQAWRLALGRPPTDREKEEALQLMGSFEQDGVKAEDWPVLASADLQIPLSRAVGLAKLCLSIFNLSEFVYVD